jgi:hypothetical protein
MEAVCPLERHNIYPLHSAETQKQASSHLTSNSHENCTSHYVMKMYQGVEIFPHIHSLGCRSGVGSYVGCGCGWSVSWLLSISAHLNCQCHVHTYPRYGQYPFYSCWLDPRPCLNMTEPNCCICWESKPSVPLSHVTGWAVLVMMRRK